MATLVRRLHCEMGPVLVNRTAVYKMCLDAPRELARRGFHVECTALLARLAAGQIPKPSQGENRWFAWSGRLLRSAIRRPGIWNRARRATGHFLKWRHGDRPRLFFDPLYLLFYNGCDRGAVIVYDVTTASDPLWHGVEISYLYRQAFDLLAQSRCQIIASSQNTADQLRMNWGIAPSRLTVIPLGLFPQEDVSPLPGKTPPERFFLFVGSLEPRKNITGLIEAYDRSQIYAKTGVRLRIIGSFPGGDHETVQFARSKPGVDLDGFVDEKSLTRAYKQCMAFVYPSFCEGFGLPLLEAMHHGCVCLSTSTGASPEIGGESVLYVDPYCTFDIERGLARLLGLSALERNRLSSLARERAKLFTWSRFYDKLAALMTEECRKAA
ncbi:MAG: glycosyltransferase family 4 protein [Gemmataceae bacterium]